jgi:endoglycosylceramidase
MRLWRLLALALICAAIAPGAAAADSPGQLHTDGRWFRDAAGRVVVLHGLFAVWKGEPYYPPDDPVLPNGFTDADADHVAALGFDAVRLAWFWRGLEPTQGQFDPAYLDGIAAVERRLARRGVYVVLDSHQDGFGDRYNGLGFPDFVSFDDGLPFDSSAKFPLNYFQPATSRAFDNFYANRGGAWLYYARAWQRVAARFRGDPMVVGYDLMNEPWPGSEFASCLPPSGCPDRDRTVRQPMLDAVARAIRAVDRRRPVFYEPTIWFNQGAANGYVAPPPGVAPAALSFHNQCPTRAQYQVTHDPALIAQGHLTCPPVETRVYQNAEQVAARLGGPPLMTEVAATSDDDYDGLECVLERAERFMTGYTYGLSWRSGELRHLAPEKAQVIARVFPRAVAGTPTAYGFDPRTGVFHLTYVTSRRAHGPTVISVPRAVHFPNGYRVRAAGAWVVRAGGDQVLLANKPWAREVSVTVEPPPGDATPRPVLLPCG